MKKPQNAADIDYSGNPRSLLIAPDDTSHIGPG
jgi:hypothetical protein